MRSMVVVGIALGCGAAPPPPAPPGNTPPSAPPDSHDALLDHLRADRDDMCACTERRCARKVEHATKVWHGLYQTALADQPLAAPTTPGERALADQTAACAARANAAGPPIVSPAEELRKMTTEMCACAEQPGSAARGCANRVIEDEVKWVKTDADPGGVDKPDDTDKQLAQQLATCAQKAFAAGATSQSPDPDDSGDKPDDKP
jgi:hypothetical protein